MDSGLRDERGNPLTTLRVFFACDRATRAAKPGRRVYRVGPRKVSIVKRGRVFVGKLDSMPAPPHVLMAVVKVASADWLRLGADFKVSLLTRRERVRG